MNLPSARRPLAFGAAALTLCAALPAAALPIDTGIDDLKLRWDNTLRYNLGMRVDKRSSLIGNSAVTDEGTYRFDRGDLVTNRLDLLSEMDLIWRSDYGVQVSGAAWHDFAYSDRSRGNPNAPLSQIPSYQDSRYNGHASRLYHGPSGELLDAFAFAKFSIADVPVTAKLGRHALFWGESLLLNGVVHSVGYAQVPLDLQKGSATPGVEAKELFRPLNSFSTQAQLTETLSLAAQVFLDWEAFRYPEGGTYLGPVDFLFDGPDRQFLPGGLGFASRGAAVTPKPVGDWGLAARWSPKQIDGTFGAYYRNYSDKVPQVLLTQVGAGSNRYNLIYADQVSLFGLSYARQVLGVSIGSEFSYRRNTPLTAQVLGVSPTGLPARGDTSGPRGDTLHAVVNALGLINDTPLFDAASWVVEATWSQWTKVRSGESLFNAVGFAPCNGRGKWDGCATRNYAGLGINFTPIWYQALPDLDFYLPMSVARGMSGNAALTLGGNEGNGNYSIGVGADYRQQYRVDLRYSDYIGQINDNGTAVTTQNGLTSLLKDRGFVTLTFKATF